MSSFRDMSSTSKAIKREIEALGYRFGLAVDDAAGVWHATANRDSDQQFHHVRAETEEEAVATLAESVGIDVED